MAGGGGSAKGRSERPEAGCLGEILTTILATIVMIVLQKPR